MINYNYTINEHIQDDKRDLIIINRFTKEKIYYKKEKKYTNLVKYYIYQCQKCGYIAKDHPISEQNLKHNKQGCPVCAGKQIIKGINDIATTDPWMIPFFVNREETNLYSHSSDKKVLMKCPDCGSILDNKIRIANLYHRKEVPCARCKDGYSFPGRFMRELLKQLNIKFEPEFSPDWIGNLRYDFYLPQYNVIIEMDGGIGHGHIAGGSYDTNSPFDSKARDDFKDKMAQLHGITIIRFDCKRTDFKHMVNIITNSVLSKYFNINDINYIEVFNNSISNLTKSICKYYMDTHNTIPEIMEKFNVSFNTVYNYLLLGSELGWCDYNPKNTRKRMYKPVEQYDLLGNFIRKYDSITEANKINNFRSKSKIGAAASGKAKTAYGYIWKFTKTN